MNVNDVTGTVVATMPEALLVSSLGTATSAVRLATSDGPHFYFGAAMGSALAGALGVAEGVPYRQVVAVLGDGDFLMGASSLWSLASLRPANLTVIVLADGSYSITGGQPLPVELRLAEVAEAMAGIHGVAVDTTEELDRALHTSASLAGPMVVEAILTERVWPGPSPFVDPTGTVRAFREALAGTERVG